jgi:hypothetical protein
MLSIAKLDMQASMFKLMMWSQSKVAMESKLVVNPLTHLWH